MNDDSHPWKVRVEYPYKLIELSRESQTNPICILIRLAKAAEERGGKPSVDRLGRQPDSQGNLNIEGYEFDEALKAGSFVDEAKRIFDECDSGQLRQAVAKERGAVIGQKYGLKAWMTFEAKIGRSPKRPR